MSENMNANEVDDPFLCVFQFFDWLQENAVPLLGGIVIALIFANADPGTYEYFFNGECYVASDDSYNSSTADGIDDGHRRFLAGSSDDHADDDDDGRYCARWLLRDCPIFGHRWTIHFVTNDILMCFHFALAMKEVTEALLPGGSLNPPTKAINIFFSTLGGVLGPVLLYFALLNLFIATGMLDKELEKGCGGDGCSYEDLAAGWGVVTATDIVLAWLVGRVVFGNGHPAIDYLLLLAVADDALGMVIIAVFYPDPYEPVEPVWLLLVLLAMLVAFLLRKWHFRKERASHQDWQAYVWIAGVISWIGLVKAHLNPALALVPIVPFMPGPNHDALEHLEEEVEEELEEEAVEMDGMHAKDLIEHRTSVDLGSHEGSVLFRQRSGSLKRWNSFNSGGGGSQKGDSEDEDSSDHASSFMGELPNLGDVLQEHHEHERGRGLTIQAGLYAGLVGHTVDDALKVIEYDEDGNEHLNVSTLDEFEQFWKPLVDMFLGIFALVNAGVRVDGVGSMTLLVSVSLILGKFGGVVLMYKVAKYLGFPAPLGVRGHHVRMIGLIATLGLTVALFVSDVAFTDDEIKSDSKLGALLSGLTGFVCWGLSKFYHFKDEDVVEQAHAQVEEELAEMIDHFKASHRCMGVPTQSPPGEEDARPDTGPTPPVSSTDSSSAVSSDEGGGDTIQLAARPGKIVAREQARLQQAVSTTEI